MKSKKNTTWTVLVYWRTGPKKGELKKKRGGFKSWSAANVYAQSVQTHYDVEIVEV